MRQPLDEFSGRYQAPLLLNKASELSAYVQSLSLEQLSKSMKISPNLAVRTRLLWRNWTADRPKQRPAIDSFLGDIYSGLQVDSFDRFDREYANRMLVILSGLYGGLRALDSIYPYRLEMGYRFSDEPFRNLYNFWGDDIASLVPTDDTIINLSAVEYTKALLPYMLDRPVITPKFQTINPKTGQLKFVTVHAKIARGAFAHWLIKQRIESIDQLSNFEQLGYKYQSNGSTSQQPLFVAQQFGGLGLSVRLK